MTGLLQLVLMLELKHHRACVWKIQYEGVCREANTARGKAKCCICLETPPEYCIFCTHKQGGALSVILYFLVASGSEQFSSVFEPLRFLVIRISNPKQPSCKKQSAALRKAMVKKDVKSKVAAKKWL